MDRPFSLACSSVDIVESHFDNLRRIKWCVRGDVSTTASFTTTHLTNSILVDLVHTECLDVILLENLSFTRINVSKTNVHQAVLLEYAFLGYPGIKWFYICSWKTKEEGDWATMQVA
jgi:hypothetical protein